MSIRVNIKNDEDLLVQFPYYVEFVNIAVHCKAVVLNDPICWCTGEQKRKIHLFMRCSVKMGMKRFPGGREQVYLSLLLAS